VVQFSFVLVLAAIRSLSLKFHHHRNFPLTLLFFGNDLSFPFPWLFGTLVFSGEVFLVFFFFGAHVQVDGLAWRPGFFFPPAAGFFAMSVMSSFCFCCLPSFCHPLGESWFLCHEWSLVRPHVKCCNTPPVISSRNRTCRTRIFFFFFFLGPAFPPFRGRRFCVSPCFDRVTALCFQLLRGPS